MSLRVSDASMPQNTKAWLPMPMWRMPVLLNGKYLQKASVIKEVADVADNGCPGHEDVPHKGVHNRIQVPLAVPRLLHPKKSNNAQV